MTEQLGLLLTTALAWIGYFISVGGDTYHDRFLLLLFPIGFICLLSDEELFNKLRFRGSTRPLTSVILALCTITIPFAIDGRFRWQAERFDRWYTVGLFLKESYPPGSTLAADAIGKVPLYCLTGKWNLGTLS
ncbi:MAG: hypothetical protein EBS53_15350 [Bacteroidetes bacterium]|nr:hypothetical protein [Bacteroidota bacterium]